MYPIFLEIVESFISNQVLSISMSLKRILLLIVGNLFYKGEHECRVAFAEEFYQRNRSSLINWLSESTAKSACFEKQELAMGILGLMTNISSVV